MIDHLLTVQEWKSTERAAGASLAQLAARAAEHLDRWFGTRFAVVDVEAGQVVVGAEDVPARDEAVRIELCRVVARSRQSQVIEDHDPVAVLAIPLAGSRAERLVAVGAFLIRDAHEPRDPERVAQALGRDAVWAEDWLGGRTAWTSDSLERTGRLAAERLASAAEIERLELEGQQVAEKIAATYEEITLLYRLLGSLHISRSDEDLGRLALDGLTEVLPAESIGVLLLPIEDESDKPSDYRRHVVLLSAGDCPLSERQFLEMVEELGVVAGAQPCVTNAIEARGFAWAPPELHELIAVPIAEGQQVYGYLAAFNHVDRAQFGTAEASLLASVATIIGTHCGNIDAYRQQADLLAGIVRALTSAIDAKDPYTCGHSDRVARVAVRLGRELGCDTATLKTIYLGGLLHDVGKIGIDDNVLRKPGRLTPAEFEHIKTHVEIGYNILVDLKRLGEVLPIVRFHHESWNGNGYPQGLAAEQIPFLARILAVADAFDAMGSDRPYRQGMDEEKLDGVLREGAGVQWDPEIIAAFFRVRDDIREIAQSAEYPFDQGAPQWS